MVEDHTYTFFLGGNPSLSHNPNNKTSISNFFIIIRTFFSFLLIITHVALRLWKYYAPVMNGETEISVESYFFTSNLTEKLISI